MEEEPKLTITMGLAIRAKNRGAVPRGPLQLIPSVYLIWGRDGMVVVVVVGVRKKMPLNSGEGHRALT